MPGDATTRNDPSSARSTELRLEDERLMLVVGWCAQDPSRAGEVIVLPADGERRVIGRGMSGGELARLVPATIRPGAPPRERPLDDEYLSRAHLVVTRRDPTLLEVENVGRRALRKGGAEVRTAMVREGDVLEIDGRLVLVAVRRPAKLAPTCHFRGEPFAFGEPDANGIVGESRATWELRDHVAFVARHRAHVLVHGESGTGKELVARAIHAHSARAGRAIVARNAATIPAGLVDAELFGNVKNYPNPGMAERPGLVGEADGSTLFLDELGELDEAHQAHLLRVLDEGGEYQRLGDARARRADVRLIGATNRPLADVKHDLVARLKLRIYVPSLRERREDVPLLVRRLLRRAAADREIAARFFAGAGEGEPRVSTKLVAALLAQPFRTNVRELDALLWHALGTSVGDTVQLTPAVEGAFTLAVPAVPAVPATAASAHPVAPPFTPPAAPPSEAEVRAALDRCDGVRERAWRELGLSSRYALKRLIRKYAIADDDE